MPSLLFTCALRRAASVLFTATVTLAALAGGSLAAERTGNVDRTREVAPAQTTQAEISAAPSLHPALGGITAQEPEICAENTLKTEGDLGIPPNGSIDVSPSYYDVVRPRPGTKYSTCMLIHNGSAQDQTYRLSTVDLYGSSDPQNQITLQQDPQGGGTWIHPLVTEAKVPAGGRIRIPVLIDFPSNPPGGTSIGGLKVNLGPASTAGGAGVSASVVQRYYFTFPGGTKRKLKVSNIDAPRVMTRTNGTFVYRGRFDLTNPGTVVDLYKVNLDVSTFGREVFSDTGDPLSLLPSQATRVTVTWKDLPWIGWFKPTATIESRGGPVTVDLPHVLLLPPLMFVVAFIAALLVPIVFFLLRWRRRRREWMQYLEDDDAYDEDDVYDDDPVV
jgi:hypothetical protein